MRPLAPNADAAYAPGELFDADVKDAFSRFTTLRYLTASFNAETDWADRKLPGDMQAAWGDATRGGDVPPGWGDRAAVWENEGVLANETGKDRYVAGPAKAMAEYI